jgi:hypothetical protein
VDCANDWILGFFDLEPLSEKFVSARHLGDNQ